MTSRRCSWMGAWMTVLRGPMAPCLHWQVCLSVCLSISLCLYVSVCLFAHARTRTDMHALPRPGSYTQILITTNTTCMYALYTWIPKFTCMHMYVCRCIAHTNTSLTSTCMYVGILHTQTHTICMHAIYTWTP